MNHLCRHALRVPLALAFVALLALSALSALAAEGDAPAPGSLDQDAMAAMMAKAQAITAVGDRHAWLERFEGTWDTETRVLMPGSKPEKGVATFSWLIDGRWLQMRGTGTMFGKPHETFLLLGYDTFKMSYVTTMIGSMDNAMLRAEGDIDPKTGALLLYGTLDEYLTGEHDKMVKYIWRFPGENEMTFEIHDLPIGETGTKVVEISYERREQNEEAKP